MNPYMVMHGRILHLKVVIVPHASIIPIHYGSLSVMFTPLHSRMNQELLEKYVCVKVTTMKSADSAVRSSYRLKLKYPFRFSVSYVQLVTQQFESRTV